MIQSIPNFYLSQFSIFVIPGLIAITITLLQSTDFKTNS